MSTDKRTVDWYNRNAQQYADHVRDPADSKYHAHYEKPAMYKLLPDLDGKSVISLGCGPGEDSHYLKEAGASRSVGIDISKGQIDIAKRTYPDCEFLVMDMESLDFPDQFFDFAYSSLALSYVKDWQNLMAEVYRILKPGSKFLFSCEHPVVSAMQLCKKEGSPTVWSLRIERDKAAGKTSFEGDYLNQHPTPHSISEEVTTWHRPFSKIFADIADSGLVVRRLVEPLPLPEMKKLSPTIYQSLKVVPDFLIMELEK
jgi:SAM-dependent methyltransferase